MLDRSGTEVVTAELATGLAARGHRVAIYSPACGRLADRLRSEGIPVVDRLELLPFEPQILHGHHHVETLAALEFFPRLKGVYVCHDRTAWVDIPPAHPRLLHYVAVDENCLERLTQTGAVAPIRASVIPNAVDLRRFVARSSRPDRPQRALVFGIYARPRFVSGTGPVRLRGARSRT